MRYYRIHTKDIAYLTQQPRGIFTAIGKLVDSKTMTEEEIAEYWKNREYFEKVLPVPPYYEKGNPDRAITWFKDSPQGKDIYSQMIFYREMAKKYGLELYKSECDFIPGEIIYEDDFQIAVKNCITKGIKTCPEKLITYRKATSGDINEIQSFVDKAKLVMDKQGIFQWDEIYPTVEDFSGDEANQELYVGEVDGKLAVCFTLNKQQDEEYFSADWENKGDDFIVIHRLCVNPEFQGQGIGKKTCNYIEEIAQKQGAVSIKLDAFTQNPISLAMYGKLGYKAKGYADWRKGRFVLMEKLL